MKSNLTEELCLEKSQLCDTQKEFREKYSSEYRFAYKNDIMRKCCSHMTLSTKPNGYWTKENCHEEALKYTNKTDFQKYSGSANHRAIKEGWIDEICSHMKIITYKTEYWTKENCKERALLCKSRREFNIKYYAAHKKACKNGWMDEICSHMKSTDKKKRCIYVYEFDDKSAYIGLTYNIKNRHSRHMNNNKSSVKIKSNKNINFNLKKLTKHIDIKDAKIKENYYVEKYKNDGWKILNKAKTGSIGGITIKWTKDKCKEKALKCKTKSEFYEKYSSASGTALKNGWMDEICLHMNHPTKQRGYWNNYENCISEAILQKTRNKFRKNSSGAFKSSIRNGWKEKIYEHMNWV